MTARPGAPSGAGVASSVALVGPHDVVHRSLAPSVVVVVHDVAAATQSACERLLAEVHAVAPVATTLLAVPCYRGAPAPPGFVRWLGERRAGGDEVALHGWTHRDDGVPRGVVDALRRRHYTRGEGEFVALSREEAQRRIDAGRRWCAQQGFAPEGFVAPAWLLGPGAWEALAASDFTYTCTLRRLVLLRERRALVSQSLVYSTSSAWRRQASLAWNAAVAATLRRHPLVRFELHPPDAEHAAIRRAWQRLLEAHLAGGREACTLAGVARRLQDAGAALHDHEHEGGGEPADGRAGRDVAGVVQAEHHA